MKEYLYGYEKYTKSKKKKVSPDTRNKNKNAILYFYREVCGDDNFKLNIHFKRVILAKPILTK